jgi:hypothetical protein
MQLVNPSHRYSFLKVPTVSTMNSLTFIGAQPNSDLEYIHSGPSYICDYSDTPTKRQQDQKNHGFLDDTVWKYLTHLFSNYFSFFWNFALSISL